jgi:hypothetical protein
MLAGSAPLVALHFDEAFADSSLHIALAHLQDLSGLVHREVVIAGHLAEA